eukprot:5164835-Amphidinium_carterae.1
MHASCALVRKHHPECGGQTLSLQAYIHMAQELLPGKVCVDKELRTLRRRIGHEEETCIEQKENRCSLPCCFVHADQASEEKPVPATHIGIAGLQKSLKALSEKSGLTRADISEVDMYSSWFDAEMLKTLTVSQRRRLAPRAKSRSRLQRRLIS